MAISIDWPTKVINVPQADLTLVSGTLYELDVGDLWDAIKALEAGEDGIVFEDAQDHNKAYSVAGVTYARKIEIVNGYSVTFEDGQYTVRLTGANNNLFDVESGILNQNQVQIIAQNSAGLVVVTSNAVTQGDIDDIADGVWNHSDAAFMLKVIKNKKELAKSGSTWQLIVYDDDDATPILTKDIKDKSGNEITDLAAGVLAAELATSV